MRLWLMSFFVLLVRMCCVAFASSFVSCFDCHCHCLHMLFDCVMCSLFGEKNLLHMFVIGCWVILGQIIGELCFSWLPVIWKLLLLFMIKELVIPNVHCFCSFWDDLDCYHAKHHGVVMGVKGWGCPSSNRVWRMGAACFTLMKSTP